MDKRLTIVLALLLSATILHAQNQQDGLRGFAAPIDFTYKDMQIYLHTAYYALDHKADGDKVTWRNPYTGTGGYFVILNSTIKHQQACRTMQVNVYSVKPARTRSEKRVFCRVNRQWHDTNL